LPRRSGVFIARTSWLKIPLDRELADLRIEIVNLPLRRLTRYPTRESAREAEGVRRPDLLVHCIGVVLGGRPGERLTERLSMPVSADTLLRILQRRSDPTPTSAKIVGIDDFAWRRGHRYGTIVCDLEQHRIVDLLADREVGTVTTWLKNHSKIEVVCRDRGGGYRDAATKGAPQAVQITDRWHLLENASPLNSALQ